MIFTVITSKAAEFQILNQANWYEEQQAGLGYRFLFVVAEHLLLLETVPFAQIRYDNIRCVPVKGFPVIMHIEIDEVNRRVYVHALIHAARNPDSNWLTGSSYVSEPDYRYAPVAR